MNEKLTVRSLVLGTSLLVVVAVFHWALGLLPLPVGSGVSPKIAKKEPIEVETSEDLPFVQTSRPRKQAEDDGKKARFGGLKKNRVEKEMKSGRVGRFSQGGRVPETKKGDGRLAMSDLLPRASSQSSVLPKDVEEGGQTLLNTDPIMYASFLNRVQDEIYGPWNRYLNEAMVKLENKIGENIYVTKLRLEVDRNGNIRSMRTLKGSGVFEIDSAPKRAFWEIEPFPNPPISDDTEEETIPFVFEFHFHAERSIFGKVDWVL